MRRALALLVTLAIVLDIAIFALIGFVHMTRSRVRVRIAVEHEIVQVFVNCQLAHAAYVGGGAAATYLELGWLRQDAIVTIQVRGRRLPGYYEIDLERDSQVLQVARVGGFGQPLSLPSGRVVFARSYTAAGRPLGALGCQSDAPTRLAFASAASEGSGLWSGPSPALSAVTNLSSVVPWVMALIGAVGLMLAAVLGKIGGGEPGEGRAPALGAGVDIALALLCALVTKSFDVVFGLCVGAGIVSLLVILKWLVSSDIGALRSRLGWTPAAHGASVGR